MIRFQIFQRFFSAIKHPPNKSQKPTEGIAEYKWLFRDKLRTATTPNLKYSKSAANNITKVTTENPNRISNTRRKKPLNAYQIQHALNKIKKRQKLEEQERWEPIRRINRPQMARMRTLYEENPELWTKERLSREFRVSYSAVVRILHSKWQPEPERQQQQDTNKITHKHKKQ